MCLFALTYRYIAHEPMDRQNGPKRKVEDITNDLYEITRISYTYEVHVFVLIITMCYTMELVRCISIRYIPMKS
jgi:hypothetical protein